MNDSTEYDAPEYVVALLMAILHEYRRVYWNVHQQDCEIFGGSFTSDDDLGQALGIDGLDVRSYWWGDENDPRADLPNFAYGDVAITWYKHAGRGTTVNVQWEPAAWVAWFDSVVSAIRAADTRDY